MAKKKSSGLHKLLMSEKGTISIDKAIARAKRKCAGRSAPAGALG
jgi:hypothetical protein